MCHPTVFHYYNGEIVVLQPAPSTSKAELYSPEGNNELHYAWITLDQNGNPSLKLLCSFPAGDPIKGVFYENTAEGTREGSLNYCQVCMARIHYPKYYSPSP